MPDNPSVLRGFRRELTRELFEELAAIQCEPEEILGYVGTTAPKLNRWCRATYRRSLQEILPMVRQDGLIAIRRAGFDQLKKSATIITQQYNRFLSCAGPKAGTDPEAAIRAVADAVKPDPEEMRALFQDPDAGTETENGGEPD